MLTTLIVAIALAIGATVTTPSTPVAGATVSTSASSDGVFGSGPPG